MNIFINNYYFINNKNKGRKKNNSNRINNNFSKSNISLLSNSSKNIEFLNNNYKARNYIIKSYKGNYSKLDDSLFYDNIYNFKNNKFKEDLFNNFFNNIISFLLEKKLKI